MRIHQRLFREGAAVPSDREYLVFYCSAHPLTADERPTRYQVNLISHRTITVPSGGYLTFQQHEDTILFDPQTAENLGGYRLSFHFEIQAENAVISLLECHPDTLWSKDHLILNKTQMKRSHFCSRNQSDVEKDDKIAS